MDDVPQNAMLFFEQHPESYPLYEAFYEKLMSRFPETEPYPGRWTTHFVISETADLDEELFEWVAQAYAFAQYK